MSNGFLPSRLEALRDFLKSASALLVLEPSRYGLVIGEAQSFSDRVDHYSDLLDISLSPPTRNVTTIEARNLAKAEMLQLVRPTLKRIRDNAGVALEDKRALGLKDPDLQPTKTARPQTVPVLTLAAGAPLVHQLTYCDEATPTRAARPKGTAGMQLVCTLAAPGAAAPTDPESARFVGLVTRQRYSIEYPADDASKTAWYWARWHTATGLVGPWSQPAKRTVAA